MKRAKEGKFKEIIFLLIFLVGLIFLNPILKKNEIKLIGNNYKGREGLNQKTFLFKVLGMKRVGTSLIWIDQTQTVGGDLNPKENLYKIKENSDEMSYLNPYFVSNYSFSGTTLGLIRVYDRVDLASEIFEKGISYNSKNNYLKHYYSGLIASSKNDIDSLLESFEKVVEETRDDLLIGLIASIYEKKYKEEENLNFLEKSIKYWSILLDSKEEKYKNLGKEKILNYGSYIK